MEQNKQSLSFVRLSRNKITNKLATITAKKFRSNSTSGQICFYNTVERLHGWSTDRSSTIIGEYDICIIYHVSKLFIYV